MQCEIRQTTPADVKGTESLAREVFWDQFRPGAAGHLVLFMVRRKIRRHLKNASP